MHLPGGDGGRGRPDLYDQSRSMSRSPSREPRTGCALEFSVSERDATSASPIVMTVKWIVSTRVAGRSRSMCRSSSRTISTSRTSSERRRPGGAGHHPRRPDHGVRGTASNVKGMEADGLRSARSSSRSVPAAIRLDPVTVSANMAVGRVRTNSFFNPYMMKYERVSVQSEPVELEVLPLPEEDKPAEFYGLRRAVHDLRVGRSDEGQRGRSDHADHSDRRQSVSQTGPVAAARAGARTGGELQNPGREGLADHRERGQRSSRRPSGPTATRSRRSRRFRWPSSIRRRGRYVVARTEPIPLEVSPTKILTNADVEGGGFTAAKGRSDQCRPYRRFSKGSVGELLRFGDSGRSELLAAVGCRQSRVRRDLVDPAGRLWSCQRRHPDGRPDQPGIARPQTPAAGGRPWPCDN